MEFARISDRFGWLVEDPSRLEVCLMAEPDLVHSVDEWDWTLLMHACSDGRTGTDLVVVQMLLTMGAHPMQSTALGTAFGMCALHGHVDIADYLAKVVAEYLGCVVAAPVTPVTPVTPPIINSNAKRSRN